MVDPRTPVIVGVGQFTERIDLDGYRGMSSVELATEAARAALHDCGAGAAAVAQAIDTVAGTRQFEISGPQTPTLGVSDNYPRSVARNVGAEPARAILEVIGGQSPQHLVTEFAGAIAAGEADCTAHARPFLLDPRWAWNAARTLGVEPPSLPLPAVRATTILPFKPRSDVARAAE